MDDHKFILNQIIQLKNEINHFKSSKNSREFYSINSLIHTIKSELKQHQYLEDKVLFIRLKQNLVLKRIITTLTAEHMILWDKIDILEDELRNFQVTQLESNLSQIENLCVQIIDLLKVHIKKEENDLFPSSLSYLSAEEIIGLENYLK